MFRHQLTILRKKSIATASAVLFLLTGPALSHAATISLSNVNRSSSWGAMDSSSNPVVFSTVNEDSLRASLNVTSGSQTVNSYTGATLVEDTTLTFSDNYTLSTKVTANPAITLTFSGPADKTLTVSSLMNLTAGSTVVIEGGTLKLSSATPNTNIWYMTTEVYDIKIGANAVFWMDQVRGFGRQNGNITVADGGILRFTRDNMLTTIGSSERGGILELQGTAQVQASSASQFKLFSYVNAKNSEIRVTGTNANAKMTGYNGSTGVLWIVNGAGIDQSDSNSAINVVDATSTLTIDLRIIPQGNATGPSRTGFNKTGAGTLKLTHAGNSYIGATLIKAGTLDLGTAAKIYTGTCYEMEDATYQTITNGFAATPSVAPNYELNKLNHKSFIVVGDSQPGDDAVLSVSTMTQLGNLSANRKSFFLDGGTLEITGDDQNLGRGITVGASGGKIRMANTGVLTINGTKANSTNINMYGNLTLDAVGDFVVSGDLVSETGRDAHRGGLIKTGSGTLTITSTANDYTGNTQFLEGETILTGKLYAGDNSGTAVITVGKTGAKAATLTVANFGAAQFGNLAADASAFVLDGGELVVTGNTQTGRAFTVTKEGGSVEMQTAGQTLNLNQNVVANGDMNDSTLEFGGEGDINLNGKTIQTTNGTVLKTGSGTLTAGLSQNMANSDIIVREGTLVLNVTNGSYDWKNNITIESGAVMTLNTIRALGRQFGNFTMQDGSILNVNVENIMVAGNGTFMKDGNNVFVLQGNSQINISEPGALKGMNSTFRVESAKDSEGNFVRDANVHIVGPGRFYAIDGYTSSEFNVVGVRDVVTLDTRMSQEGTALSRLVKTGDGTMIHNWRDNSVNGNATPFKGTVDVNAGTYAASGVKNADTNVGGITAANLNVNNSATAYIKDGSTLTGNLTVGKDATFSAGYTPAQDSTLLNSVGTIDVNGNVRIAGRLVVDAADGAHDVISVGGEITLENTFKFVVAVDSYEDYVGWTSEDPFEGEYNPETLEMLEGMMEDGTLMSLLEADGTSLGLTLDENGRPVLFDFNAVPEPSTWAMMILGVFGLGFIRRRASLKK